MGGTKTPWIDGDHVVGASFDACTSHHRQPRYEVCSATNQIDCLRKCGVAQTTCCSLTVNCPRSFEDQVRMKGLLNHREPGRTWRAGILWHVRSEYEVDMALLPSCWLGSPDKVTQRPFKTPGPQVPIAKGANGVLRLRQTTA